MNEDVLDDLFNDNGDLSEDGHQALAEMEQKGDFAS